jgi:hypothetical protein
MDNRPAIHCRFTTFLREPRPVRPGLARERGVVRITVLPQEPDVFLLEVFGPMMLFLSGNIRDGVCHLGNANGEGGIPGLPGKTF